jgi:uncharacterized membrane protein (UPF0127 family)
MYKIGQGLFCLEECSDFKSGLSGREDLRPFSGMIFKFDQPGYRSFHMKDCLIPLDIIYIKEGEIVKIYHNCQPCEDDECLKYECESSDTVIELKGGTCKSSNISEGLVYRLI